MSKVKSAYQIMPRISEGSVSNPPTASEWIDEYRKLKADNKRLRAANENYDRANRAISKELNETRLLLAKAETRIEELEQISVDVVVEEGQGTRSPIVTSWENY